MAEDVICLLDYIGWTADRELNIVGISLGGMIAQGQFRVPLSVAEKRFMKLANIYRTGIPNTEPHFIASFSSDNPRRARMEQFSTCTLLVVVPICNSKLKKNY